MSLHNVLTAIRPIDEEARQAARRRLDALTKPRGSLGALEDLAAWYVGATGERRPKVPRAVVYTFAADHGVTAERVSAYPAAVTAQMVLNFLRGGAAINVLAAHAGAEVRVVDIGVAHDFGDVPQLIHAKIRRGTANLRREAAMRRDEACHAIETGMSLAASAAAEGVGLLGVGEMGIGNTTPTAAIAAVFTGHPVEAVTGRGTGLDDAAFRHKIDVIEAALRLHQPDPGDPLDVVTKIGGLEIAGMAGVILGAAAARVPVVLDGFIAGAAALVAVRLQPAALPYVAAAHRSVEPGHRLVLEALRLKPLLDLDLRLGEGTGACLGMSLVRAAVRILTEMATFEEAGVSNRDR